MKDESIAVRVTTEQKENLKGIAVRRDVPMSQVIREAVKQYLESEGK